ncbi:MAG TPA: hypothetical protein VMC10_19230 [Stellaceae bacterium]|nr:hypothetical protein [Stellaceae bacterium]
MVRHVVSLAATLAILLAAGGALAAAGITMAQAKREMIGDGYTNVQNLKKSQQGWTASAMESGKPVTLVVNRLGDVDKTR